MIDPATRRRSTIVVSTLGGIVVGLSVLLLVLASCGDNDSATTTSAPPTTTSAPTTTTAPTPTTTTESTTTTTAPVTTTAEPFGDTDPKEGEQQGDPGGQLLDVRVGAHPDQGFTRVVFDFSGTGLPMYRVAYSVPPFVTSGEGAEVPVAGNAFLVVAVSPARTFDIDDPTFPETYPGPKRFSPGLGAITEIVFIDDFEAFMHWVVGLDAPRGFEVSTLADPPRLVIDIAD